MEIEKKFTSNYLTSAKYPFAKLSAIFLLSICVIFSNFYWDKSYSISSQLHASGKLIFESHEYWRLFTTSLIHGDLQHLLSNCLMLYILTYFVTSFYGFFISVLWSLTMGMLTNYLVFLQYSENITLVGASGIIYYLWGFWLVLYLLIQKQMSLINRLLRIGAVFLILLVPTSYSPSTSYLAHYIGLIIGACNGVVYYMLFRKKIKTFEVWKYKIIEPIDFDYSGQEESLD